MREARRVDASTSIAAPTDTSASPQDEAEASPEPVIGNVSVESKFGCGIVPGEVVDGTVVSGSSTVVATAGAVVGGGVAIVVGATVVTGAAVVVVAGAVVVVVAGGPTTTDSCTSPHVPETALLFASPE